MSTDAVVTLAVTEEEMRWLLERRAELAARPDSAAERDALALEMYLQQFAEWRGPGMWSPKGIGKRLGYSSSREEREVMKRAIGASLTDREFADLLFARAWKRRDALEKAQ